MKYAEEQITRPQLDGHSNWGYGKRRVLVRKADRFLIFQEGHKCWNGIGSPPAYVQANLGLFTGGIKDRDLGEGILSQKMLQQHAVHIFEHFGERFDLKLVVRWATLLLDEPGEVDGPPPRPETGRRRMRPPYLGAAVLYRVRADDLSTKVSFVTYKVEHQDRNGRVTLKQIEPAHDNVMVRRSDQLEGIGLSPTRRGAVDLYLKRFREAAQEAYDAAVRAEERRARANRVLSDEKIRVQILLEIADAREAGAGQHPGDHPPGGEGAEVQGGSQLRATDAPG